ncbi:MAG: SRPBCC family protein [Acidimicrobiales bacterium]
MTTDSDGTVSVKRRIEAPAHELFGWLAEPSRHPSFDGSGMLTDGSGNRAISAVGHVFTMKMHNEEMGDYEMRNHVVAYVQDEHIVWEPVLSAATRDEDLGDIGRAAGHRWGYELKSDGPDATIVTETFDCTRAPQWLRSAVDDGRRWLASMTATLEHLDEQCSRVQRGAAPVAP